MRADCARIMVTECEGNQVQGSKLQNDVASCVRRLEMPEAVHEEYTIPGLGSIVDIALPEAKLVIEVDGPSHYTHHEVSPKAGGPPVEANGPTRMKVRQIMAFGWRIASVPYFEWEPLKREDERQAYLQAKLQDVLEPGEYAAHASKRLKATAAPAPSMLNQISGELAVVAAGGAPPADPRLQAAVADPRLQAAVADPRLQAAVTDPRLQAQAASADPRLQTAAQASCAAALLGASYAGSCAGVHAGGRPGGQPGGQAAGFGAQWGSAAGSAALDVLATMCGHGVRAATAAGAAEAAPPKKLVTDEDLDDLDL